MQLSSIFWSFSKEVQNHILYFSNEGRGKSATTTIAVGRAIANRLSLPSGEVENIDQYFRSFLEIDALRQISRLNELFLLEPQEVLEFVAKFYKVRYSVLFPRKNVYCVNSVTALQDFIGVSQYLDQATVEVVQKNPTEVMRVNNAIQAILNDPEFTKRVENPSTNAALS